MLVAARQIMEDEEFDLVFFLQEIDQFLRRLHLFLNQLFLIPSTFVHIVAIA